MPEVNGPVDASALKALAHPLRTAMLSRLLDHGSATATQLARELGESTGQTSYHLRQLERHGLVEDDPGHSGGRERWWRPVDMRARFSDLRDQPGGPAALATARQWALADRVQTLTRWVTEPEDDPAWADAASLAAGGGRLTPEEADALTSDLERVLRDHLDRAERAEGDGAPRRRVRVYLDLVPVPEDT